MREIVRDYVRTLNTTYLQHVGHLPPAERGALPLVAARGVTVIAAAARRLHLVATSEPLPPPHGQEVQVVDEHMGTTWTVRFFDASVLPGLGLLTEDTPADVRRVLGVTYPIYHLTLNVGGGLTTHHAQHSGVALANRDAKTVRDLERVRRALPGKARLVDEFGVAVRLGLDSAAALLAAELTTGSVVPAQGATADSSLRAVLEHVSRP